MANVGAIGVHDVASDDVEVTWLRPDDPSDNNVVVGIGHNDTLTGYLNLYFDDREAVVQFIAACGAQVAELPAKAGEEGPT